MTLPIDNGAHFPNAVSSHEVWHFGDELPELERGRLRPFRIHQLTRTFRALVIVDT